MLIGKVLLSQSFSVVGQRTLRLPLGVALADGPALVVEPLAASQGDFHLDPFVVPEIQAQGNDGITLLLHLALQTADLAAVHEQLTGALGLVAATPGLLVGSNVGIYQPKLTFFHLSVAISQIDTTSPDRFDFRASEDDPSLVCLVNEVIVPRFAISRNCPVFTFHLLIPANIRSRAAVVDHDQPQCPPRSCPPGCQE